MRVPGNSLVELQIAKYAVRSLLFYRVVLMRRPGLSSLKLTSMYFCPYGERISGKRQGEKSSMYSVYSLISKLFSSCSAFDFSPSWAYRKLFLQRGKSPWMGFWVQLSLDGASARPGEGTKIVFLVIKPTSSPIQFSGTLNCCLIKGKRTKGGISLLTFLLL